MPLQDYMQLVSVDDHVIEPPDVWRSRLPSRYLDVGPRVVSRPDEGLTWQFEGRLHPGFGLNAVAGSDVLDYSANPRSYDEMRPGCYDPVERLKDMDADGVHAQMLFPTFPRFAGLAFYKARDKELALLCVQAWNDYMIDEWCATAPDRFIPLVILPLWDPQLCAAEIARTAAKGARAITFPDFLLKAGMPSLWTDHWDPLLSAAADVGMPLCMHFGSGGLIAPTSPEAPATIGITLAGLNSMAVTTELIFSDVFTRHPGLKIALSEGGCGWVPYILERSDFVWARHKYYSGAQLDTPVSELFRKHIWVCFITDDHGLRNADSIGIDRMTWESDYPHADSLWPRSRDNLAVATSTMADEDVHRIVELNARQLFNFPRVDAAVATAR